MNHAALILSIQYRYVLNILIMISIMLAFLYLFLTINTVYLITTRNSFNEKTTFLRSDLGDIESNYINTTSAINIDLAYKLGFSDNLKNTVYITRVNETTVLLNQ